MVAVISKRYGLQYIELAEDIVSETFLLALETWNKKGIPPNPTAWLYLIAKQKTFRQFKRGQLFHTKILPEMALQQENQEVAELDFSPQNIKSSQLQMLFAVCTPLIASEAQIGLALRILCGFSLDEIAEAFLSNKEAIAKRLYRAKEKLRLEKVKMELPPVSEINNRLDNVLHIIYLLFNEGYYSKTQNQILRQDLCLDALRLGIILTEYEKTNQPKTNALLALMCFHASRFNARSHTDNLFILYDQQDKELWDLTLIKQGITFLDISARGNEVSSYHLEARIACWHCMKEDSDEKWISILNLYNQLLLINYSPGAALNRAFAVYKVKGQQAALSEMEKLNLENNHFYYILLGELYKESNRPQARLYLKKAHALACNQTEKQILQTKINNLS